MIERARHAEAVRRRLSRNPVVALVGARQAGKTTLARAVAGAANARTTFFDLERAQDLARLEDPDLALTPLRGLVVLDEIQRRPNLFPTLRVLADRPRTPARFLVLGNAAQELLRQSAESLAGRLAYHELPGLSLDEVGMPNRDRLWLRGGFPRAFTGRSNAESARWRRDFMRSFLERDVPQLGIGIPATTLERSWSMLAHYHGQVWNASEFGRSFGVSLANSQSCLCLSGSVAVLQPPAFDCSGGFESRSSRFVPPFSAPPTLSASPQASSRPTDNW